VHDIAVGGSNLNDTAYTMLVCLRVYKRQGRRYLIGILLTLGFGESTE
jgi:hypothetical protein